MGELMGFTAKVDVLDLIIDVLKEHEKTFDSLIERPEKAVNMIERRVMR